MRRAQVSSAALSARTRMAGVCKHAGCRGQGRRGSAGASGGCAGKFYPARYARRPAPPAPRYRPRALYNGRPAIPRHIRSCVTGSYTCPDFISESRISHHNGRQVVRVGCLHRPGEYRAVTPIPRHPAQPAPPLTSVLVSTEPGRHGAP